MAKAKARVRDKVRVRDKDKSRKEILEKVREKSRSRSRSRNRNRNKKGSLGKEKDRDKGDKVRIPVILEILETRVKIQRSLKIKGILVIREIREKGSEVLDINKVCRGICTSVLAFIVGGIAAWFFTHALDINYLTVLPVEALQQLFVV